MSTKDKFWKLMYMLGTFVLLAVPIVFIALNITLIPPAHEALFNRDNALYQNEDLSKATAPEGVVKQFVTDVLEEIVTFSFLDLSMPADYQVLINGEKDQDLPDHRDKIRPYFSPNAHINIIEKLESGPWMSRIYRDRGYVRAITSQPPIRRSTDGWEENEQGRLYGIYDGIVVAVVTLPEKNEVRRYRIDYTITLTRKPLLHESRPHTYFFQPLVKRNVGEWWITEIDWEMDRVM